MDKAANNLCSQLNMTNNRRRGKTNRKRQKQLYIGTNTHGDFVGDWVGQVKDQKCKIWNMDFINFLNKHDVFRVAQSKVRQQHRHLKLRIQGLHEGTKRSTVFGQKGALTASSTGEI